MTNQTELFEQLIKEIEADIEIVQKRYEYDKNEMMVLKRNVDDCHRKLNALKNALENVKNAKLMAEGKEPISMEGDEKIS